MQVIRLPRPPAHRWPKEDSEGQQQQQQQQEGQQEPDRQQQEPGGRPQQQQPGASAGEHSAPGSMSAAHKVALAKLPDAIEWLMAALGTSQPDGEQGAASTGSIRGAGSGPGLTGRAPAGPLKPSWQQGGSSGGGGGSSGGRSRASSVEGPSDSAPAGEEGDEADGGEGDEEEAEGAAGQQAGSAGPKFLVFAHHR